ncbi:adenine deaminase C-terminal domain-containing protein [Rubeoparvulum massiliense]|uniref:adenine deaminase C-terminal domain-containing protein n=1 Tax=Rubeoparvulum massiliense TaxID=1631346 RepID=UPI00065E7C8C|nr:adenine deaminase C-terminal domain-containing protein [Rubeoparvulum massiliense]
MLIQPWKQEERRKGVEVALRKQPATTWIQNATVLDVYTGEWRRAHIVLYNERIAYVGEREPLCDERTHVIPAEEYFIVPGYIEPHAHPFQLYNPLTLGNYLLRHGTTMLVSDTLPILMHRGEEKLITFMEEMNQHPIHFYWWVRFDPQSVDRGMQHRFHHAAISRLLRHPAILQVGELTAWPQLLFQGEPNLKEWMEMARQEGKQIDAHIPGASAATIQALATTGVTACHEAISAEEVLARLQAGMYAELRHSSIRPDLPIMLPPLLERGVLPNSRTMLTTDGSTPPALRHGFTDHLIHVAIEAGVPIVEAYRMATLYPATFHHMDGEVGGVAPGRMADLLFLRAPDQPTPIQVMIAGKIITENMVEELAREQFSFAWEQYMPPSQIATEHQGIPHQWFQLPTSNTGTYPVLEMRNAVITKLVEVELPSQDGLLSLEEGSGYLLIAVLHKGMQWLTKCVLKGFATHLEALATTNNSINEIVVIGSSPAAMARAVEELRSMEGGIVIIESGEVLYRLPLPLAGMVSDLDLDQLIPQTEEFVRLLQERGYTHADPIYSLFFFTSTHLPLVRLTPQGLYHVKEGRVLYPAEQLEQDVRS